MLTTHRAVVGGGPPADHPQIQGCRAWIWADQSATNDLITNAPLTLHGSCYYTADFGGMAAWVITTSNGGDQIEIVTRNCDGTWPCLGICTYNVDSNYYNGGRFFTRAQDDGNLRATTNPLALRSTYKTSSGSLIGGVTKTSVAQEGSWRQYGQSQEVIGETVRIWKDGVAATMDAESSNIPSRYPNDGVNIRVGGRTDLARSLNGKVNQFRWYNLDEIDRDTYPTVDDLVLDIYNNPGAPL